MADIFELGEIVAKGMWAISVKVGEAGAKGKIGAMTETLEAVDEAILRGLRVRDIVSHQAT